MILTALIDTIPLGYAIYTLAPAGAMLGQEAFAFAAAPGTSTLFAAALADKTVKVIDAKTRIIKFTLTGHTFPCRAVAWSPKGDRIATGSENAEIRIWNAKTGALVSSRRGSQFRAAAGL